MPYKDKPVSDMNDVVLVKRQPFGFYSEYSCLNCQWKWYAQSKHPCPLCGDFHRKQETKENP